MTRTNPPHPSHSITAADFLAFVRGTASHAMQLRCQRDLESPASEIAIWINAVHEFKHGPSSTDLASNEEQPNRAAAFIMRDALIDFVLAQVMKSRLRPEQAYQIETAGRINAAPAEITTRMITDSTEAMLTVYARLHPEFAITPVERLANSPQTLSK